MIIDKAGSSSKRAKDKVSKALTSLIEKDDFKLITITQICQEAKISRQTFYNNFETKEDIIKYYIEQLLRKYISLQDFSGPKLYSEKMFKDMPFSKKFLKMLDENDLLHFLYDALYSFVSFTESNIDVHRLLGSSEYDSYFYDYVVSACVSILRIWTKNDFKESPETLGKMIDVFFYGLYNGRGTVY